MKYSRGMLAYTMWHWPHETVEREIYETHHRHFHAVLARQPSPGFRATQSCRVAGLPWANSGDVVYQDRFFIDAWSVFDGLEPHVISGAREEPHRRLASTVGGAIAGVYGLRLGTCPIAPRWSYWFSKPRNMPYDELESAMRPVLKGAALWGRQLVLGPTPEFCVESETHLELPGILESLLVRLEPAWHAFDEYDRQRRIESNIIT